VLRVSGNDVLAAQLEQAVNEGRAVPQALRDQPMRLLQTYLQVGGISSIDCAHCRSGRPV